MEKLPKKTAVSDFPRRSGAIASAETKALYQTLPTAALKALRHAFAADRRAEADGAFCTGRIAVIDAILKERI